MEREENERNAVGAGRRGGGGVGGGGFLVRNGATLVFLRVSVRISGGKELSIDTTLRLWIVLWWSSDRMCTVVVEVASAVAQLVMFCDCVCFYWLRSSFLRSVGENGEGGGR